MLSCGMIERIAVGSLVGQARPDRRSGSSGTGRYLKLNSETVLSGEIML